MQILICIVVLHLYVTVVVVVLHRGFAFVCYSCCLLLPDLCESGAGGEVKRGDVCYGMLRAATCVYESDLGVVSGTRGYVTPSKV